MIAPFRTRHGFNRNVGVSFTLLGVPALAIFLAFATSTKSPPWIARDWTQWTHEDCIQILTDSPWAVTFGVRHPAANGQVTYANATAQISSSLVIRQAWVRQWVLPQELLSSFDPQQKREREQQAAACLNRSFDDRIVVTVLIDPAYTDDFKMGPEMEVSHRKYHPLLTSQNDFRNPCNGGYAFPRVVQGKSVVEQGDKKLEILTPSTWKRDFEFNIQKMVYNGKPDF